MASLNSLLFGNGLSATGGSAGSAGLGGVGTSLGGLDASGLSALSGLSGSASPFSAGFSPFAAAGVSPFGGQLTGTGGDSFQNINFQSDPNSLNQQNVQQSSSGSLNGLNTGSGGVSVNGSAQPISSDMIANLVKTLITLLTGLLGGGGTAGNATGGSAGDAGAGSAGNAGAGGSVAGGANCPLKGSGASSASSLSNPAPSTTAVTQSTPSSATSTPAVSATPAVQKINLDTPAQLQQEIQTFTAGSPGAGPAEVTSFLNSRFGNTAFTFNPATQSIDYPLAGKNWTIDPLGQTAPRQV